MRRSMFAPKTYLNSLALAGILLASLGTGCGDSGGNGDAALADSLPAQDAALQESGGAALPYCTDKPALASVTDLSGTWVARAVGSQIVVAPIVGALHIKSVFYVLMNIAQNGTDLVIDGHYCDRTEIDPPTSLAPVVIPDAWAHTEKVINRIGSFAPSGNGFYVLTLPLYTEVAGAALASPNDPLPTSVTDPQVIDEDNDGHPGITIRISGQSISGSIYSVQSQTTAVTGIVVAPDRIEGAMAFSSTQNVLDSDPASVAVLYRQSTTSPDPATCSSSFAMVRVSGAAVSDGGASDAAGVDGGAAVDGGDVPSCAWVRANETVLFPQ
jgi:hypothetical protein